MTDEAKWEACGTVGAALQLLNRTARSTNAGWRRKFRLAGVYFLQGALVRATDPEIGRALGVAERYFDGAASLAEYRAALADTQRPYEVHRNDLEGPDEVLAQALGFLLPATDTGAAAMGFGKLEAALHRDCNAHGLALLRELFGNPFRPVAFAPGWRTDTAVAIARQMYESRDFSAMPILADALQDAGCDSDDILNHCRAADAVHVRGCWVGDLVLGKA